MYTLSRLKESLLRDYPAYEFSATREDGGLTLLLPGSPSVYSWKSEYFVKLRGTVYEMNMIHLAGDSAVPVVGKVMHRGKCWAL